LSATETEKILSQLPKISLQALLSEGDFSSTAKQLYQQLHEEGFVILELSQDQDTSNLSEEFTKSRNQILHVAEEFFSLSTEEKIRISRPGEEQGKRNAFSGYSEIHFINNDNQRDQEKRDVFQVRLGEQFIPWPNTDFQEAVQSFYRFHWRLSLQIVSAIAESLNIPASEFLKVISQQPTENETENETEPTERQLSEISDKPETSLNTNLCLFRYHDVVGYKEEQKCMVHVDNGLVTILSNWSTGGALQVLSHKYQHFIPIDLFLDPTRHLIVYCGHSMQFVTRGEIQGQIHRVVRQPNAVRYSFPFELKPFDAATLRRFIPKNESQTENDNRGNVQPKSWFRTELDVTNQTEEYVFEDLMRQISWQKVMQKVARADSYGSDRPWFQDFYSTDMN